MKTLATITLLSLAACALPPRESHEELMERLGVTDEQFEARIKAHSEWMEGLARRSLEEQGGYGPPPTRAGLDAAVDHVRAHCKNPASFELVDVLPDRTTTLWEEQRPHHGWRADIYFRATNSYGGVVPGQATVLIYQDRPIYTRW